MGGPAPALKKISICITIAARAAGIDGNKVKPGMLGAAELRPDCPDDPLDPSCRVVANDNRHVDQQPWLARRANVTKGWPMKGEPSPPCGRSRRSSEGAHAAL